jgi:hypothetical protein
VLEHVGGLERLGDARQQFVIIGFRTRFYADAISSGRMSVNSTIFPVATFTRRILCSASRDRSTDYAANFASVLFKIVCQKNPF